MARWARPSHIEQARQRAIRRDRQREKFTVDKGLCFICKRPLEPYPDGVVGATCMRRECIVKYLPGSKL